MDNPKTGQVIFLLGAFGLISLYALRPLDADISRQDPTLAAVERRSFDVEVNSVGALDAVRSYMAVNEIKGDRGKIVYLAEDGAQAQAGDILVRFNAAPFEEDVLALDGLVKTGEATVAEAKSALEFEKSRVEDDMAGAAYQAKMAELELNGLINGEGKAELAQLEGEMEKARQEHARYEGFIRELESLQKRGYSNPAEIERAVEKKSQLETSLQVAKKKYDSYQKHTFPMKEESAKAKLEKARIDQIQAKKGGGHRVARAMAALDKAETELETAKARLAQSRLELSKTIITAPYPGVVILYESFRDGAKRKPRVGDAMWQGQAILYLPDTSSFLVKTSVREVDLHNVAKGAPARIKLDAFPEAVFAGRVKSIGALAEAPDASKEAYFQTQVEMDGTDPRLRPGMTARVSVIAARVENAPAIPAAAVFGEGNQTYCYKRAWGRLRKTPIILGRHNEDFAEVKEGLAPGDVVSLLPPS